MRQADERRSNYPPAKPEALECEPLKAAGKAACAAYTLMNPWLFGEAVKLLEERVGPTLPLVDWARDSHKMERCNAAPCTKTAKRAERDTAGNVKLVLPPRQSRGYSHFVIEGQRHAVREHVRR